LGQWVRRLLPLLLIWLALGMAAVIIAFITEYAVVDRIIDHLKLTFVAANPPPSHVFTEVALMEAEENGSLSLFSRGGGISCPDMICGSGFRGY